MYKTKWQCKVEVKQPPDDRESLGLVKNSLPSKLRSGLTTSDVLPMFSYMHLELNVLCSH